MKRYAVFLLLPFLFSSCAHVISKEYVQTATTGVSFSQITQSPERYLEKTFILGGTIADMVSIKEGSELEVVQNPVDNHGDIVNPDISEGRCLVETSRRLDPLIYKKGRQITFAGKLIGSKEKRLGELEYRYPVFRAEEIFLWPMPKRAAPHLYYYDPFLSPYPYYFYDPFWYGPNPWP